MMFARAVSSLFLCLALCLPWYNNSTIEELHRIKTKAGIGFVDAAGVQRIAPKYEDATYFRNGLATVREDGKWGLIRSDGAFLIEPVFQSLVWFSEGLACIEIDGNWGFVDTTGGVVIPPEYEVAWNFSEGLACVRKCGEYGYIDHTGGVGVDFQFTRAHSFSQNRAVVKTRGAWGVIDHSGQFVVPPSYSAITEFSCGHALACITDSPASATGWDIIDIDGETVKRMLNVSIPEPFHNGLSIVRLDPAVLNRVTGELSIVKEIGATAPFTDLSRYRYAGLGLLDVIVGENESLIVEPDLRAEIIARLYDALDLPDWIAAIDTTGSVVFVWPSKIGDRDIQIDDFTDSLAAISIGFPRRTDCRCGYINMAGELVIDTVYDSCDPIFNERAYVEKNGKGMLLDMSGDTVWIEEEE